MTERREVQEVGQPNLLEDVFPYDRVPLITFDGLIREEINGRVVEFDPQAAVKRDLFITDTTFRDGQQARPPYSPEQIRDIYSLLVRLSGPNGVIRLTEFFLYTPKDRQAVDLCRELGHDYPRITGWIRADEGDFRLVKDMGLDETGMLTSASDYHIFHKQKMTRGEAFDQYIRVVEEALATGVRPRCHLEDVTRADIEGFVLPFVQKLAELGEQAPDHLKPKVRLCDTLGYGVTGLEPGYFGFTAGTGGCLSYHEVDDVKITVYPRGTVEPVFACTGDANNDQALNIADAISVLGYLFGGGTLKAPDGTLIPSTAQPMCKAYAKAHVPATVGGLPGCMTPCGP